MGQPRIELRNEPPFADVLDVAMNLRARDREELFATRYGEDPADLARSIGATGAFRWGAYRDGKPIAMIGAFPRWPRVWTAWAFGTDEWPTAVLQLSRHVRRFMLPALYNAGATRVDAMALETHTDARRWLEALGAKAENRLDKWGKNGQTFVCYVWTREQAKATFGRYEQEGSRPVPPPAPKHR